MNYYVKKMKNGNNGALINQMKILEYIKDQKVFSQRDIVDNLNYKPATVSNFINSLKEQDILKEVGVKKSTPTGGKKQRLLSFNSDFIYGIGIEIRNNSIIIAIVDILLCKFEVRVIKADILEKGEKFRFETGHNENFHQGMAE